MADVQSTAERLSGSDALIAVDAISSLAAVPLETDDWGLDIVLTSSHKALMCPAGLAFAAISPAAQEATKTASLPRYYMDWQRAISAQAMETPFSTAISLVRGLDVALDLILADGLAAVERHLRLGRAARAGVKAMGLELFSPDADSSAVVTAIRMPPEIDGQAIVASMRDRSGVTIIGGQGEQRGKIVRFGHIGYVDVRDVAAALEALGQRVGGGGRRHRARHGRSGGARGARRAGRGVGPLQQVLIGEPIAEAGIDLLRERYEVDVEPDRVWPRRSATTTRSSFAAPRR